MRAFVVVGGVVVAGWGAGPAFGDPVAAPSGPSAPSVPPSAAACPGAQDELTAMNAARAWAIAGTKGAGAVVSVIGTAAKVAEAQCSILALAPEASVRLFPVDQATGTGQSAASIQSAAGAGTVVVVFADTSVDLSDPTLKDPLANAEAQGVVVVAAAGDGTDVMPNRPAEIVNVSAADLATKRLHAGSASGPKVTLAAYGNDTATAAGYVAATAALLHAMPGHTGWPVRQVAAQLAGTINPISGSPRDDQIGYGVLQPVQALSTSGAVDPGSLPGFAALFPVLTTPPASPGPGGSSSLLVGSSGGGTSGSDTSGGAQQPGTAPATQAKANSGSGGTNPLLLTGFGALLAAIGLVVWQRFRKPEPVPLKGPDEWEPPTGQRHSGYSTPPE